MVLRHCSFIWIRHLWVHLVSCFNIYKTSPLPDDVIFNVLSRLPHEGVAKCRRVCKKWLELTSTIEFAHTHLQRQDGNTTEKVLLLECSSKNKKGHRDDKYAYNKLFILNKKAKGKRMLRKMLPDLNTPSEALPSLYGSCNGLLIFNSRVLGERDYLFNPTTQERINIRCNEGVLCGFYFRPSSKEYILLYISKAQIDGTFKYYLFSLESESIKKVCDFPYFPIKNQVYSNGALYWQINNRCNCENSIMEFNVEKEVFFSFHQPGKRCGPTCKCRRIDTCLLEITGQLLFCRTLKDYIDMWVLEDNENHIWVKRYSAHLDWDLRLYPFEIGDRFQSEVTDIWLLYVENGELLLFWWGRGLFLYNLEKKKVKKLHIKGMKVKGKLGWIYFASSYTKSLVSLKVSMKYPNTGIFPTFGQVTIDLE